MISYKYSECFLVFIRLRVVRIFTYNNNWGEYDNGQRMIHLFQVIMLILMLHIYSIIDGCSQLIMERGANFEENYFSNYFDYNFNALYTENICER